MFTFLRKWLRREGPQGLGFKAWPMSRKVWLLILTFKKILDGSFEDNLFTSEVGIYKTGLQQFICPRGLPRPPKRGM